MKMRLLTAGGKLAQAGGVRLTAVAGAPGPRVRGGGGALFGGELGRLR